MPAPELPIIWPSLPFVFRCCLLDLASLLALRVPSSPILFACLFICIVPESSLRGLLIYVPRRTQSIADPLACGQCGISAVWTYDHLFAPRSGFQIALAGVSATYHRLTVQGRPGTSACCPIIVMVALTIIRATGRPLSAFSSLPLRRVQRAFTVARGRLFFLESSRTFIS